MYSLRGRPNFVHGDWATSLAGSLTPQGVDGLGANFYGNWYPELLLLQLRANRSFHANRISYSLNLMSMFSQANCSSPDLLDYVLVGAGLSGWA
jgi:hypothetical protein